MQLIVSTTATQAITEDKLGVATVKHVITGPAVCDHPHVLPGSRGRWPDVKTVVLIAQREPIPTDHRPRRCRAAHRVVIDGRARVPGGQHRAGIPDQPLPGTKQVGEPTSLLYKDDPVPLAWRRLVGDLMPIYRLRMSAHAYRGCLHVSRTKQHG